MPITAVAFVFLFTIGLIRSFKSPFLGLLTYFFVYYMHPPGKYWGAALPEIRWTLLIALTTFIGVIFSNYDKKRWLGVKETKIQLLLFTYIAIQCLWVTYSTWQIDYLVLFFKLTLLYFLIVTIVDSEKKLIVIIVTNVLGAAYIGFEAIQTHIGGRFEKAGLPGIEDGNLLSIHLIAIITMTAVLILTNIKKKFFLLVPLAFVANLLFMTGSRGGLVGLVAAGLFLVYFSPRDIKSKAITWSIVAALLATSLLGPLLIARMNQVVDSKEDGIEKSAQTRIILIESQWEMFKDSPILGFGHRGTLLQSPFYIPEEYMTKTKAGARRASHNFTMTYLVDHGIIGFALISALLFSAIRRVRICREVSHATATMRTVLLGLTSGLTGVLISSQFSNSKVLEINTWLIGLIAASVLILNNIKKSNNEQ